MSNKAKIFVISAPSGTGKSTVIEGVLKKIPKLQKTVSYTTRQARDGEKDGIDYHFITEQKFEEMKNNDLFIEWANVYGNLYATSLETINNALGRGIFLIKDIDTQGALNIKKQLKDLAILIFIAPPSIEELEKRLRNRGTDSEEIIQIRLQNALKEMSEAVQYDYRIINSDLQQTIDELKSIIGGHIEK
jgi:guanylate kinase